MVKFLEITEGKGKKKLPIRVSYFALKMLKEETGKSLSSITEDDFESYEILLYHSLVQGARITKQPLQVERENITQVMDEVFFDFMKMIPEFFAEKETPATIEKKKGTVAEKK